MDNTHYISPELLSIEKVQEIILQHISLALSNEARVNIQKCRDYLDKKMASHLKPIYGINTGFGSLCNVKISNENLSKLQENLVKSHSCGTGDEVPNEIVKLMLLLKIQSLSYGHSGGHVEFKKELIPNYIYECKEASMSYNVYYILETLCSQCRFFTYDQIS